MAALLKRLNQNKKKTIISIVFDINMHIHMKKSGSKVLSFQAHESKNPDAPAYHFVNSNNTHWSAALFDEKTKTIREISTPGDGNCGVHAFYMNWLQHRPVQQPQPYANETSLDVTTFIQHDVEIAARKKNCREFLDQLIDRQVLSLPQVLTLFEQLEQRDPDLKSYFDVNRDLINRVKANKENDSEYVQIERLIGSSSSFAVRMAQNQKDEALLYKLAKAPTLFASTQEPLVNVVKAPEFIQTR